MRQRVVILINVTGKTQDELDNMRSIEQVYTNIPDLDVMIVYDDRENGWAWGAAGPLEIGIPLGAGPGISPLDDLGPDLGAHFAANAYAEHDLEALLNVDY